MIHAGDKGAKYLSPFLQSTSMLDVNNMDDYYVLSKGK